VARAFIAAALRDMRLRLPRLRAVGSAREHGRRLRRE
jgi:hypothetical protein